jgi:glycosyltransferase involved in cell wall biosynthesis
LADLFAARDRMEIDHVDFALNRTVFRDTGARPVDGPVRILFFARPGVKRRAFPVGVEALEAVSRAAPDTQIALYGMDEAIDLGFEYENLGELPSTEIAREMGRSHIHLSFSKTNVSWVPFEAMACGCAVVECQNDNVEAMLRADLGTCLLTAPKAERVAEALLGLVRDRELLSAYARRGTEFINERTTSWEQACADFELLMRRCVFADTE